MNTCINYYYINDYPYDRCRSYALHASQTIFCENIIYVVYKEYTM